MAIVNSYVSLPESNHVYSFSFLPWESNHNQLFILVWTIKNWQCFMERYCKLITSNCTAKLSILSFDVEAKFEKVPVEWTCEQRIVTFQATLKLSFILKDGTSSSEVISRSTIGTVATEELPGFFLRSVQLRVNRHGWTQLAGTDLERSLGRP